MRKMYIMHTKIYKKRYYKWKTLPQLSTPQKAPCR